MFGGSSNTAFHDVGSVHIFLFFTKGTVRELQDSNSVKKLGQAVMSIAKSKRRHSLISCMIWYGWQRFPSVLQVRSISVLFLKCVLIDILSVNMQRQIVTQSSVLYSLANCYTVFCIVFPGKLLHSLQYCIPWKIVTQSSVLYSVANCYIVFCVVLPATVIRLPSSGTIATDEKLSEFPFLMVSGQPESMRNVFFDRGYELAQFPNPRV